jgi:hypothetical protein
MRPALQNLHRSIPSIDAKTASSNERPNELTHEREIVRMAALLTGRQAWVA